MSSSAKDVFEHLFVAGSTPSAPGAYERYRAVRALLSARARAFPDGARALLLATGWNRTDPDAVVTRWTSLRHGRIPSALLPVLGITHTEIQNALDADIAEWERAAAQPTQVRSYIVRVFPSVYIHQELPRPMSVPAAIEHIALIARQRRMACAICLGQVATAMVEADGRTWMDLHRPRLREAGGWLVFAGRDAGFGRTSSA